MSKLIRLKNPSRYKDIERIQDVLEDNSIDVDLEDAEWLWQQHSDSSEASWLLLPDDDDEIYSAVVPHILLP